MNQAAPPPSAPLSPDVPNVPNVSERQPAAFYLLVFLQAWERFSYYGIRALLAVYLVEELALSRAQMAEVFALLFGVGSVVPLLGGYLADRVLSPRKVLLAGAAVATLGAAALSAPVTLAAMVGAGLLTVGTGLLRPCLLVLLGNLYRQGDPRRDSGFTWLYVGIQGGALLAPMVLGALGSGLGARAGIAAGAVAMLGTTLVAAGGQRALPAEGYVAGAADTPRARLTGRDAVEVAACVAAIVGAAVGIALSWPMIGPVWGLLPGALKVAAVLALVALGFGVERARSAMRAQAGGAARPLGAAAWQRLLVLLVLGLLTLPSWVALHARTLWAAGAIRQDRDVLWMLSLDSLVVLLAGPAFALVWRRLDAAGRPISGVVKIAAGLLLGAAGAGLTLAGGGATGSPAALVAMSGLLAGLGELCLIPIGHAMVTKLAPARGVTVVMGAWLALPMLGSALGPLLEGDGGEQGPWVLGGLALVLAASGGALLVLTPALRRWMYGAEEPEAARAAGDPYRGARAPAAEPETEPAAAEPEGAHLKRMVFGALWAIGGLSVTLASLAAAEGGGRYVVAYGAILYGVITFVRGLAGWSAGGGAS